MCLLTFQSSATMTQKSLLAAALLGRLSSRTLGLRMMGE
jgi:hypothetical protein